MMFMTQSQDLRGDRGGKEKKKPKAQKPAKGAPQRESMVVPTGTGEAWWFGQPTAEGKFRRSVMLDGRW